MGTGILLCRAHEKSDHPGLRRVLHHDARLPRLLRVVVGALRNGHCDRQPPPSHHLSRPVLQHNGNGRCEFAQCFFDCTLPKFDKFHKYLIIF